MQYECRALPYRRGDMTTRASELPAALEAAWQLLKYRERPVEIWEVSPDVPGDRKLATLTLEWEE